MPRTISGGNSCQAIRSAAALRISIPGADACTGGSVSDVKASGVPHFMVKTRNPDDGVEFHEGGKWNRLHGDRRFPNHPIQEKT